MSKSRGHVVCCLRRAQETAGSGAAHGHCWFSPAVAQGCIAPGRCVEVNGGRLLLAGLWACTHASPVARSGSPTPLQWGLTHPPAVRHHAFSPFSYGIRNRDEVSFIKKLRQK